MRLWILLLLLLATGSAAAGPASPDAAEEPEANVPAASATEEQRDARPPLAPIPTPTPVSAQPADAESESPAPEEATASEADASDPSAEPSPSPAVTPETLSCDPKVDVCLTSEVQGREEGHIWGRGFTDLRAGDLRVQTDSLDIYDVTHPDGSVGQRLVAEGNVVLLRGDERMTGKSMTMDLDSGRGVIENAVGYLEPGVFVRARKVERLDAKTFRIRNGTFTSCCQPNPRWSFWSPYATLKVGNRITAVSPTFLIGTPLPVIKKLPLVWLPAFIYPIKEDGRATGLLIPDFNVDFKRGVDVRFGFFWAMNRSWDQTFSWEYRPKLTPRIGHELRYALDPPSSGSFTSYFFPPQTGEIETLEHLPSPNEDWEYDLNWNAVQMLPAGFKAKVLVNQTSPQNIQADITRILDRQRRASLVVQNRFGAHSFQMKADSRETFVGDRTAAKRYLPQIVLSLPQTTLGRSGILYEHTIQAAGLVKKRAVGDTQRWWRADGVAALTRHFTWNFLRFTPRVESRQTWYEKSWAVDPETGEPITNDLSGDAMMRRYIQSSLELEGPTFSKVYLNPGGFLSDRFKHVIGPEISWTYRESTGNSTFAPTIDNSDSFPKEHSLNFGLVQRLYAKRKTEKKKSVPVEVLSWRIYQTYYVEVPKTTSDPDFTSPLLGPNNTPAQWSPLRSELRLNPTPGWTLSYQHEYDVNFHGTTNMELSTRMRSTFFDVQGRWMRSSHPNNDEDNQRLERGSENVTGKITLRPFGGALDLSTSAAYDNVRQSFIEKTASARIKVQCFGLMLQFVQREIYGDKPDRRFGFAIELENLGSLGLDPDRLGSFLGG
ncbi:MAG: LPS assembly protein LptD [Vicinamibacteria bacterium]|nr:LPS assembly protein LptD [Vicinamibacteria bacterium]